MPSVLKTMRRYAHKKTISNHAFHDGTTQIREWYSNLTERYSNLMDNAEKRSIKRREIQNNQKLKN